MNIAYHFTGTTLRDGSPIPPIGHKLVYPGKIAICSAGYHWSRQPFDALQYAPGPMLHKVVFGGDVQEHHDKGVSSERTILATIDATYFLRRFAADQALSVSHLWPMPDAVREYLTGLDESKRAAARDAARAAAWDAARDAARAAAWAAAEAAAWAAARAAARDAARAAAWDAARDAARAAAEAAAKKEFNTRVEAAFAEGWTPRNTWG